jgi:hypothetical protein
VEGLEEENVVFTLVPVIEELNQEHLMEPSVSSSADIKHAGIEPKKAGKSNKGLTGIAQLAALESEEK